MTGADKAGLAVAAVAIVTGGAVSGVLNDHVRDLFGISKPTPVIIVDDQRPAGHTPPSVAPSVQSPPAAAVSREREPRERLDSAPAAPATVPPPTPNPVPRSIGTQLPLVALQSAFSAANQAGSTDSLFAPGGYKIRVVSATDCRLVVQERFSAFDSMKNGNVTTIETTTIDLSRLRSDGMSVVQGGIDVLPSDYWAVVLQAASPAISVRREQMFTSSGRTVGEPAETTQEAVRFAARYRPAAEQAKASLTAMANQCGV